MHREDDSNYLLYIEPPASEKLSEPVEDELTELMELALSESKTGTAWYSNPDDQGEDFHEGSGYKGFHRTECGETSSNKEYLLENGMITNSLAPFYLRWYRNSIPQTELNKLEQLKQYYSAKRQATN